MKVSVFYVENVVKYFCWLICLGFVQITNAQAVGSNLQINFCGSFQAIPPNGSHPDSLITDRFGNLYDLADLVNNGHSSQPNGGCSNSGYFDPTYYGTPPAQAIDVFCQVLNDVSNIIRQRAGETDCGTLPSEKVEIQIAWLNFSAPNQAIVNELDLALPLPSSAGGIGTPFYSNPSNNPCKEVILDRPFIKVNGGRPQPAGIFDGRILVNSAYNWNFDFSQPSGGFPNQVDLYSVALHEVMHLMGYASRIALPDAYSLWDQTLRVVDNYQAGGGGNLPIRAIQNPSECISNCWQNMPGFNSIAVNSCNPTNPNGMDLVVGDAALAPIGGDISVNPNDVSAFNGMLSHLSVSCSGQNVDYVMQSGISPNIARRNITDAEQEIFCSLGYLVESPIVSCDGCYNIGHQDVEYNSDEACCYKTFVVCMGETIEILNEELLCNDISNTSITPIVTRVWDPNSANGLGLVSNVAPNIDGTGWIIEIVQNGNPLWSIFTSYSMRYTVTGCDCRQHNMTFNLNVLFECPACEFSPEPCDNLLCYSDFENFNNLSSSTESFLDWPIIFEGNIKSGTPDICVTAEGDHNLHLLATGIQEDGLEAVNLELKKCVEPGCTLEMSMDLSAEAYLPAFVEIWGSRHRPCDATILGTNPVSPICAQNTNCDQQAPFEPICIFFNEFSASTISPTGQFWDPFNVPNLINVGPFFWENNTNDDVCYLTIVPNCDYFGVFIDNIDARIHCEPTITCDNDTPSEICVDEIANISFQICAPDMPDCIDETLISPNVTLPPGWVVVGTAPTPFTLTEGQCGSVDFQVQMPPGTPVGTMVEIELGGTATGLCAEVEWFCTTNVTVIQCGNPPGGTFTCPCPSGGLNIDASSNSPLYNPTLDGVPYSVLEATFNFDANNDQILSPSEHNNCIAILGRLIMDTDLEIQSCSNIQMQPCAEILIGESPQTPRHVTFTQNTIYGCERMWRGITVEQHSFLTFTNNTIRDAEFALNVLGSPVFQLPTTKMDVTGNTFRNNHVGVFLPQRPVKSIVEHIPFIQNIFETQSGTALLPSCTSGLPDYNMNNGGYAGIITAGIQLTTGLPAGGGNDFRLLRNGIIGLSAPLLSVYHGDFENITLGNTLGGPFPAGGGACVWTENGSLVVEKCDMFDSDWGIFSNNTQSIKAKENIMRFMGTGIETFGARIHEIKDNPVLTFYSRGIYLKELKGAFGNHIVQNNQGLDGIFSGPINPNNPDPDQFHAAIAVENVLSVNLPVASIRQNVFNTNGSFWHGVHIGGVGNWDIDGNIMNFNQSTNLGAGFRLENTNGNYLYGNSTFDGSSFKQSTGYRLAAGTGNRFCCNSSDGARFGARFLGTCTGTEWRSSDLNTHLISMHCAPGTVISPQLSYGDLFNTGSGTAVHEGGDFEIINSRFEVLDMSQPHWPEAISTPNATAQWFFDEGLHPTCATYCAPPDPQSPGEPTRDGDIEDTDIHTATRAWIGDVYGNTTQYESERRLYERMVELSGLYGVNTTTDAFFFDAANGLIGKYYTLERSLKDLDLNSASVELGLEQNLNALEANRQSVAAILNSLANATSPADTLLVYQQANTAQQSAQSAEVSLDFYEAQAAQERSIHAQSAQSLIDDLPATTTLEQNRKTVLKTWLESVGAGNHTLTAQQMANITPIAEGCPLVDGSVVYMARALYRLNIPKEFVDDSLCLTVGDRSEGVQGSRLDNILRLIPNPAGNSVQLSGLNVSNVEPGIICMYDMNGILKMTMTANSPSLVIPLATLPSGMYLCTVQMSDGSVQNVKLIVQH